MPIVYDGSQSTPERSIFDKYQLLWFECLFHRHTLYCLVQTLCLLSVVYSHYYRYAFHNFIRFTLCVIALQYIWASSRMRYDSL